ncbi:LPXTG cell wall anchor domain-containing protein [Promicromonospora sp. NPDC052451]|uniref:LPXTG cell wall anchor domain-containing protein n=1 Tax=Promicromonospora sp. NPDC052451 TaxID=3364407 RepID=UPI0037C9A9CB
MLRRFISAIAIATAAVLAPAGAAHADQADTDYSEFPCVITFDSQTVTVGDPFGFTIDCADMASATVTVQISFAGQAAGNGTDVDVAGADSAQFTLDENGTVSDSATVSAPGDYTVQVLDEDGGPLSETYTITAVTAGSAAAGGGGTDEDVVLASTGATSLPYLAVAGGLLLAGVAALVVSRVRAARQH